MQASGVEAIRVVVYWADLQPQAGGPIDFGETDRDLRRRGGELAARPARGDPRARVGRGRCRPTMASPPRGDAAYAAFLTALVGRYGPRGTFWAARPDLPFRPQRQWQIWNEPNIDTYWSSPRPFAARYVRLLRASYRALKAADPGSQVVLCRIRELLMARARRRLPGRRPPVVRRRRGAPVQRAAGERAEDRAPQPRGDGALRRPPQGPDHLRAHLAVRAREDAQHDRLRDDRGAARPIRLRNAYAALLRIRRSARIRQVFWYTWLSADRDSPNSFSWSGLRRLGPPGVDAPVDKPALAEFRRIALRVAGR